MIDGIVDIHAHLLFGATEELDDGASTLAESLAMLRLARAEGVRAVFATPHYGIENGYAPEASLVRERFEILREAAHREVPEMALYLGTEWYCADDLPDRVRAGRAFTMNGTDCVLFEFLEWGGGAESQAEILRKLDRMARSGYTPILAHAERYRNLRTDWHVYERIRRMGVLIQVNAYDLCLNPSEETRGAAQFLAREGLIDFLGSDAHGLPPKRAPLLQAGVQWLYGHTDSAYADAVARGNAERLLIAPGADK